MRFLGERTKLRRCPSFSFTNILHRCRRLCRLIGNLATAPALRASVRVDPRRHGGRTGLGLFGNNETFSLRDLTRVQQLCRTCRFGFVLPSPLTVRFLGCVLAEKFTANRDRRLIPDRRLDALLAGEAVGEPLHRRCRRIRYATVADSAQGTKQVGFSGGGALLELADDALGDVAYGVYCADHFLLADNDIIKQAFKLCCNAGID
jgi:hypothetical protein